MNQSAISLEATNTVSERFMATTGGLAIVRAARHGLIEGPMLDGDDGIGHQRFAVGGESRARPLDI